MTPRLPLMDPADLDEDQRAVYEAIAGGPRAQGVQAFALTDEHGRLTGPFNALLHAPGAGAAVGRLGEAIRFSTSLPDRVREVAILAVAAHHRSDFEWYAHESVGRQVGLTGDEIERIRGLQPLETASGAEAAAYELCREALREREVADAVHDRAVEELGQTGVVELVLLIGYYQTLALVLSVFRVPAPDRVVWPDEVAPG